MGYADKRRSPLSSQVDDVYFSDAEQKGTFKSVENKIDFTGSADWTASGNKNGLIDTLENKRIRIIQKLDSLKIVRTGSSIRIMLANICPHGKDMVDEKLPGIPAIPCKKLPAIPGMDNLLKDNSYLQNHTGKLEEQIRQYTGVDKLKGLIPGKLNQYEHLAQDPSSIDRVIDQQASQTEMYKAFTEQSGALPGMDDLPRDMLNDLEKYQNTDNLKSAAKELAVEQTRDFFKGHEDKLEGAMSQMTKLKKKYSCVPDSRDLSTAIKKNSMKGKPLKERLILGGNFQILRGNPVSLDLSPYLMYRINKIFFTGAGITYRASLGIENNQQTNIVQDVYGVNILAQHKIYKGFFGHLEGTYMNRPVESTQQSTDMSQSAWSEGLMLGIGKRLRFSQLVNGTIIFTYDFLHNDQSVNPKPWNIRFGFELGKLSLPKRRGLVNGGK